MCKVKPGESISPEEPRIRLKLKSIRKCFLDRRLQWFGFLKRIEETVCSSICRTSNGSGFFPRGQPLKTWNDVVKSKKKEGKKEKETERNFERERN